MKFIKFRMKASRFRKSIGWLFHEETRLNYSQAARVEFYTNVRYIERYLKPGMSILDVGAGAGNTACIFLEKDSMSARLNWPKATWKRFAGKCSPRIG